MVKVKADWLKEAKALGLEVTDKSTVAEIKSAIETKAKPNNKGSEEREVDVAKAGKRSAKVIRETEQEEVRKQKAMQAKEEGQEEAKPKKGPAPVTRPLIERRGKKYRAVYEKVVQEQSLDQAVKTAVETSVTKFDSTLEMHIRLAVDPKQADQNIRDSLVLPHGTGKTVKVAVLAEAGDHQSAKDAGADLVGDDDLLESIKAGNLDFDVLVATPKVMAKLGQLAKILGPKGLMPNPKSGTVTANLTKAVTELKAGKIEYRVDEQGIIHSSIGKVSFGADKLLQNAEALLASVKSNKPSSVKDTYIVSIFLATTMGPSVKVQI